MSYLSFAKSVFPNSFVGKYNDINTKLLNKLDNLNGVYTLQGVKNGIAVLEDSFKYNCGTTKVRKFFGLDEYGNLISLKDKAIYNSFPSKKDSRKLTGTWQFDYRNSVMTHRTATSVNGKLRMVSIYKENGKGQDVVGQFYFLPNANTKFEHIYDYGNNIYTKLLKDPYGDRGTALEYGKIVRENDEVMPKFIREDVLIDHKYLGKSLGRKSPNAIFYSASSAVCNFLADFFS